MRRGGTPPIGTRYLEYKRGGGRREGRTGVRDEQGKVRASTTTATTQPAAMMAQARAGLYLLFAVLPVRLSQVQSERVNMRVRRGLLTV